MQLEFFTGVSDCKNSALLTIVKAHQFNTNYLLSGNLRFQYLRYSEKLDDFQFDMIPRLEEQLAELYQITLQEINSFEEIEQCIVDGKYPLVQTDIYYLPHREEYLAEIHAAHFVIGQSYNQDLDTFKIFDSVPPFDGEIDRALFEQAALSFGACAYLLDRSRQITPDRATITAFLRRQAERLYHDFYLSSDVSMGYQGMLRLQQDMQQWIEVSVEERRQLFFKFLINSLAVERYHHGFTQYIQAELKNEQLVEKCESAATGWKRIHNIIRKQKHTEKNLVPNLIRLFEEVVDAEKQLIDDVYEFFLRGGIE
nr:BtrH N-terminal domain-containing protein [Brevibacillus fulvus]